MARSAHCVSGSEFRNVVTVEGAMQTILWKCEQYLAGQLKDRNIFESEEQAKAFAKKLQNVAPDLMTRIEPMPIQNVWN